MLTREQILSSSDLPTEEVQVPEWGGSVFVRTMTGTERDTFEQSIIDARKDDADDDKPAADVNVRARLAVRVVADAQGNRIFSDADADVLGKKSGRALGRIFDVAQRLNGFSDKDVKELEGN